MGTVPVTANRTIAVETQNPKARWIFAPSEPLVESRACSRFFPMLGSAAVDMVNRQHLPVRFAATRADFTVMRKGLQFQTAGIFLLVERVLSMPLPRVSIESIPIA